MASTRIELPHTLEGFKTYVDTHYSVTFVCVISEGHEVEKETWKLLQESVSSWVKRQQTKKKKKFTPIPLLQWVDGEFVSAEVTGIHASTQYPIIKAEGSKTQQISGYNTSFLVPMNDEDKAYLKALYGTSQRADRLFKESYTKFRIDHLGQWAREKAGES